MMAEPGEASYLSIGEVLGVLLEEFPDVTISKIRFLESQGLISPERTASGYRKFYDHDVDLLRVILTEQRQNFLPLRVIKDRLETGEIDRTGEHLRPASDEDPTAADDADHAGHGDTESADVPSATVASHPAARRNGGGAASGSRTATAESDSDTESVDQSPQLLPGVLLDRAEFCAIVGLADEELAQLESFGVIQPHDGGGIAMYDDAAVTIGKPAGALLRGGVDARHLRSLRTAAEREASLYEQLVVPRLRQRNPEARAEALRQLRQLDELGAKLRAAMTRQALDHHFRT